MAQLTGNEFNNEKGTQGSLLKWVWGKIYIYFGGVFDDAKAYVDAALGNVYTKTEADTQLAPVVANVATLQGGLAAELVARANGDTVLQSALNALTAQVVGLKTITTWDATQAFPTLRADGAAFSKGNYVQITVGSGQLKAGDMLICTADGATSIAGFGDVDNNVDIATDSVFGTVKLVASLAEYNGTDAATGSKVITKSVLQAILGEVSAAITTAYQGADAALQTSITTAYNAAITTALGNYYTKAEADAVTGALATRLTTAESNITALQTVVATKANKTAVAAALTVIKNEVMDVFRNTQKRLTKTISGSVYTYPWGDGTNDGLEDDFSYWITGPYLFSKPKIHQIVNLALGGLSLRFTTLEVAQSPSYSRFSQIPVAVCPDKSDYDVVVIQSFYEQNGNSFCEMVFYFNNEVFEDDQIMDKILIVGEHSQYERLVDLNAALSETGFDTDTATAISTI